MAKRTKIVCTLGPSVDSESTLKGLINAGMDIARFNFSHGSHEEQRARMDRLRKVRREMDSPCAILLDTKGPEIRTGELAGHKPVQLMAGNSFTFTEAGVEGGDRVVSQTCKGLADVVSPGTVILVDDVYTTGATLFAATDAVRVAGAATVRCLTFARVW